MRLGELTKAVGRGCRDFYEGVEMSRAWKTKYGMRRVRVDPPTLTEALFAAEGLTPDVSEQQQIAADLMHLPVEQVRTEAQRSRARSSQSLPLRRNVGSVVVETKHSRRVAVRR